MSDTIVYDVDVVGTVRAPIDQVWALFRPFGQETLTWWQIYDWLKLDAPGTDEVGAVRSFHTKTGRTYKERLESRDDGAHTEVYSLVSIEPAVPTLNGIVTTVQMTAKGNDTVVRWSSKIDASRLFKGKIAAVQSEVYTAAIKSLDSHFHPAVGKLDVKVVHAISLAKKGWFAPSAYVVVDLDGSAPKQTSVRHLTSDPQWGETLSFDVVSLRGHLHVAVWAEHLGNTDVLLGSTRVDLHTIEAGKTTPLRLKLDQATTGELEITLTLALNEGDHLAETEETQKIHAAQHLMDVMDKLQSQALGLVQELAKGDQATYGYARYDRSPAIPDVPLEQLPRMVAGLPADQLLAPEKLGRMMQRGIEYAYSQFQFVERLEKEKDPFEAYFGGWSKRPWVTDHWSEDAEVARQLIQGLNPMMIELVGSVDRLPESLRGLSAQGRSISELIADKRLFFVDYADLEQLEDYEDMFFYAPYLLVYKELLEGGQSRLNLMAIQLERKPGAVVYTPEGTPKNRWKLAKLHLSCADNQFHQWVWHLGYAHLAMEPFAIAWHNAFPAEHPIGRLLRPHFHDTIGINWLARRTLVSDITPFTDRTFATGTAQALQMFLGAWKRYDLFANSFPEQLAARGFDEARTDGLEGYTFRDDGFLVWNALLTYITDVVSATYRDDAAVANDPVLARWAAESTDPDRADIPGFPKAFATRELLVRTLTTIVFNVSAQHSVVNYPQFDYLGYLPNRPDSLFKPMPEGDEDLTDEYVQSALPNEVIAQFQISFAYVLTLPSVHNLASIDGVKDLYPDVHLRFMANLGEISQGIRARNAALVAAGKAPYPYLLPELIAASIAI